MVSENLARELWREPSAAIGKRVRESLKGQWREVVGVVSAQREIGIRIALGARNDAVTRMFVGHGLRLAGIGIACGLLVAVALMRLMSSLLFDVSPIDPLTYVAVSAGLMTAAVVASYVPAWRATSVDPVDALRAE